MTTTVNEEILRLCQDCGEIAVNGYTDSIDDAEEHKQRVLDVESMLPEGSYFGGSADTETDQWESCDCCRVTSGTILVVRALSND